jgi:Arc/MetJ family transcription regulator
MKARVFNRPIEIDEELVTKALQVAEKVDFRGKVVDIISIYKIVGSMSQELSGEQLKKSHNVANEIESVLKGFVRNSTLAERKISVSSIFS